MLVGCGPSVDIWTAAKEGNIEAVEQHIAAGADVNPKDHHGRTPLLFAAFGGHKEIVELLIANGADVNEKLTEMDATPLHFATTGGHKEIIELLIAKGADVNAKSDNAGTPLHFAAEEGHKEIAELLIGKGADVNARNIYGKTPLDVLEPRTQDYAYQTPEDKAARKKIFDFLREHGGKRGYELEAEQFK